MTGFDRACPFCVDALTLAAQAEFMKVSAQYAESHLAELLEATDSGQSVEIARPNKASVKLTLVPSPEKFDRTGMVGSGKGMIWMSDDFDSPEANEEIARLFNESTLFPEQPLRMHLLLDTHALLWNIEDDVRLKSRVRTALEDRDNLLIVSMASLWEISTNLANGRLKLSGQDIDYVLGFMERWHIELLPVRVEHVRGAAKLPFHHGDPFDRMLIAQANVEGFLLVSNDAKVRLYDVDIFWQTP